jgi:dihydroxyacid dehydratase/phosphogluconate dehydratase
MWYEGNPCNMHLLKLAEEVKKGVVRAEERTFDRPVKVLTTTIIECLLGRRRLGASA